MANRLLEVLYLWAGKQQLVNKTNVRVFVRSDIAELDKGERFHFISFTLPIRRLGCLFILRL